MPRPRTISNKTTLERAMMVFWERGYEGTSMADLVEATGSTRQSIYGDFGSKYGIYRACFDLYRDTVVRPAIAPLMDENGDLGAIAHYFERQISLAETKGLPGPGCLVGNATTETAPGDPDIQACVERHNTALTEAFINTLPSKVPLETREEVAEFLMIAAQGLWAYSRTTQSAETLRATAATIVRMVQREIDDAK